VGAAAAPGPLACVPVAIEWPRRLAGWALFLVSETRGILLPPMFWSVVSDTSSVEASRCAYVYVVLMGNVGAIFGSVVVMLHQNTGSLLVMQALSLFVFTYLMWLPLAPPQADEQIQIQLTTNEGDADSPGTSGSSPAKVPPLAAVKREVYKVVWEGTQGLVLIIKNPHVAGIMIVSWAFIIPRTVLDFQGSVQLSHVFGTKLEKLSFLGKYNLLASVLTCLIAAFGTSTLIKRLSPAAAILVLPCVLAASVLAYTASRTLATINVALLAVNLAERAINTSAREMLYIKTSKEIKYKAKSWGDVYGNSLLKMAASAFNMFVNVPIYDGVVTCSCMLAWCTGWFVVALSVGRVNAMLEASGEIAS